MVRQIKNQSGSSILRPRARLLRTFGDELISSETVAIIELVKNAYDADATRVWIRFHEPLEPGKGMIEVIDNGHGMGLETIQNAWMEPATAARRRNRLSEKYRRRVSGEKGIGRFASSRLADKLEVITKRAEKDREIRVTFNWSEFDDETKYLDQIKVNWEQSKPHEIHPGGLIFQLCDKQESPNNNELNHGTILRMRELRTKWGKEQFESLQSGLSKLTQPSFGEFINAPKEDFQIYLHVPEAFQRFSETIQPPGIVKRPHYVLKAKVDSKGRYDLTLELREKGIKEKRKGTFCLLDGEIPKCGPFKMELRVWNRDTASLNAVSGNEFTVAEIRRYLDFASGISIYRDSFRVLPYGQPQEDWLRLDYRRFLNPTRNISNNQIIGSISITSKNNPMLRDQSNREGFIAGEAYDDLRELVLSMLTLLETRRYLEKPRKKRMFDRGLFVDFNLESVREYIGLKYPNDKALLTAVNTKEKDLERKVEAAEEVISRYRRLATLGMLIDTVLHEGRLPLSKIINVTYVARQDMRLINGNRQIVKQLRSHSKTILNQSDVLAILFRKIEPFGGRRRGRPERISLERVISDAFIVLEKEIERLGIQVDLPLTYTEVTVDQAEIQEVFVNLLNNSIYWLRQVPKDSRFVTVKIDRKQDQELEIIYSDSGPGIEEEYQDMVFDPYFSTKPKGVGLGLTIAGEIVSDYYDGTMSLIDEGPLPGATFRIVLRRRV